LNFARDLKGYDLKAAERVYDKVSSHQGTLDMQHVSQWVRKRWQSETWLLESVLAIAGLLLIFGLIADEVMEGSTLAFDRYVILAFRSAGSSSDLATSRRLPASLFLPLYYLQSWDICSSRTGSRQRCWCSPPS
jgi:hypothetical protein